MKDQVYIGLNRLKAGDKESEIEEKTKKLALNTL